MLGAVALVAGVVGALVFSVASDRCGRRIPFLIAGLLTAATGFAILVFARGTVPLGLGIGVVGFGLVPLMPVGMEYAAEITHPVPEGTSNGIVQLVGQLSVGYVALMYVLRDHGDFWPALAGTAVVLLLVAAVFTRLPTGADAPSGHIRTS